MHSFNIYDYSEKLLLSLLTNDESSSENIELKNHYAYLISYLSIKGINAQTIVVEKKYISRDFFSDYSAYYSTCYYDYVKYCTRLHFFSEKINETNFRSNILKKSNLKNWLNKTYLGYIVIKPIPHTIIGTTILKTYPLKHKDTRNFFGIRNYPINLFGYKLAIESLAFQEQDNVLSACATTAIWSTLHKAADVDYHVVIKTPFEITRDAANLSVDGGRLFPNTGLTIYQMCQALNNAGLVVDVRNEPKQLTHKYVKKLVYAYAPIGIPLILGILVPGRLKPALHAVAISGYNLPDYIPGPPKKEITWIPDMIDKFYVHDDQYGPFAKVEFNKDKKHLITDWTNKTRIAAMLIPVFHKIRISYDDVESITLAFDNFITYSTENKLKYEIYWEIQVDYSNNYKSKIKSENLPDSKKEEILYESFPKYIWIASCRAGKIKVFDFVFDATDIANNCFLFKIITYNLTLQFYLKKFLLKNKAFARFIKHPNGFKFYDKLIELL